jgi:hypothetical protein
MQPNRISSLNHLRSNSSTSMNANNNTKKVESLIKSKTNFLYDIIIPNIYDN